MADKKLRIPRKLKTETHKQLKIRTDMNSYAHILPPFLALNLRKKTFLLSYGSICCPFSQVYLRIFGQGYALKP